MVFMPRLSAQPGSTLDALRIEGGGLPHLQLVDRRGRGVIAAHQPGLLGLPGVGRLRRPASVLRQPADGQREPGQYDSMPSQHLLPFLPGDQFSIPAVTAPGQTQYSES